MVDELAEGVIDSELGSTGLSRYGGHIHEEFLPQLRGAHAVRIYEEMASNCAVVAATLYVMELLIRGVSWRVEPANDTDEAIAAAAMIETALASMDQTWDDFTSEWLSMFKFGWSYHEIVFKRLPDGTIGWSRFAPRAQSTLQEWTFDEAGQIAGMVQSAPPHYAPVNIPIEKALLFRTTSRKGNPEGQSVLRGAFRSWYFLKRIQEIEGIGIERDLAGLPVAFAPVNIMSSSATAAEQSIYTALKKLVVNIRRDEQEGVVMPSAFDEHGNQVYKLELLSSGGRRQFDTNAIITRYESRIAMVMLADFILLGHEKVGSFALSSSKTSLFATAIGAHMDHVEDVFNRVAIPQLLRLNGVEDAPAVAPRLRHGDIETPDLEQLGNYISALSSAGAALFPDGQLENRLRHVAGLPLNEEEL